MARGKPFPGPSPELKNMNKYISIIIHSFGLLCFFSLGVSNVGALGMMTQPIEVDKVLRGQTLKEELRVLNNSDRRGKLELAAVGEVKNWTSFFYQGEVVTDIEISPQTTEYIDVEIVIPQDIPNGTYQGELKAKFTPISSEDKGTSTYASVSQQISRAVRVGVTDQEIIELDASLSPESYIILAENPLKLKARYYNRGNIVLFPDLQLKISRDNKTIHNSIYPYPEDESPVSPLEQKEIIVTYNPGKLKPGKYKSEATVFLNEKKIKQDEFTFEILPELNKEEREAFKGFYFFGGGLALLLLTTAVIRKRNN